MGTILNRKIVGTLSLGLFLGTALFLFFFTHQFLKKAQTQLENHFRSSLPNYKLKIDNISTNYFNQINFSGIEITDSTSSDKGVLATAKNIKFKFSAIELLRAFLSKKESSDQIKSRALKSILSLTIQKPSLKLVRELDHWKLPHIEGNGPILFPSFLLAVEDGSIAIEDSRKNLDGLILNQINGSIYLNKSSPAIKLSAQTNGGEKIHLETNLKTPELLHSQIRVENLSLADYSLSKQWDLHLEVENPWPISKNMVLTSSITLQSKNSQLHGKGTIQFSSSTPKIESQFLGAVDLEEVIPQSTLFSSPKGKIQMELNCSGELKKPIVVGSLKSVNCTWENEPLILNTTLRYQTKTLTVDSLKSTIGKSSLNAYGTFSKEKSSWKIYVKSFPLFSYLRHPKGLKLGGELSSIFSGARTGDNFRFSGPVEIMGAAFNDRALGNLKGQFESNPQTLRLFLNDGKNKNELEFLAAKGEPLWRIERGSIQLMGGERIDLSGQFYWDSTSFTLSNFTVGNAYAGSIKITREPQKNIQMELQVKNGNPKFLFSLFNFQQDIGGTLNGHISLQKEKSTWNGKGLLELNKGHWGKVDFEKCNLEYSLDPKKTEIKKFIISQKEGSCILEAATSQLETKNPIQLKAKLHNFQIQNSHLNGSCGLIGTLTLSPKFQINGTVSSQDFSFNQFSTGALEGQLDYKDKVLDFKSIRLGNAFKAQSKIEWNQPQNRTTVTGHWSSVKKSVAEWCALFKLKEPPLLGSVELSGDISGEINNPLYSIEGQLEEVKPRGKNGSLKENFSGNLQALFSQGFLKSATMRLNSSNGTTLKTRGEANLKTGAIDMECSFQDLNVEFLQELFGWKGFKGTSAGFLKIQGDWNSPIASGKIVGSQGSLGNIPLDYWEISGKFQEKELLLSSSKLIGKGGSWRFTVLEDSWLKLLPNREVEFRLATDFANLPIGDIFLVGSGVAKGVWKNDPKTNSPFIVSQIKTNECLVNDLEIEPSEFNIEFKKGVLKFLPSFKTAQIKGEINFNDLPHLKFENFEFWKENNRVLFIHGDFCKDKPSFEVIGERVDASILTNIFKSPVPLSGTMNLNVKGTSEKDTPKIAGEMKVLEGQVGPVPLDSLETKFNWSNGILSLIQFQAKTKNIFTLDILGNLPVKLFGAESSAKKINLVMKVPEADLSFLNYIDNDLVHNAKGPFQLELSARGDFRNPRLDGNLKISDGEFDSRYFSQKAKNLDIELQILSNHTSIKNASCKVGTGILNLVGGMDAFWEDGEISFNNFDYKIESEGKKGIPIQVPELPLGKENLGILPSPSRGFPRLSLQLNGTPERPVIQGWIELEKTLFSYPPSKKVKKENRWIENTQWDLTLKTAEQTIFQNEYAYARIDGEIHLKGKKENFLVIGKINSNEGTVSLYGAKFQLRQAELEILQPPKLSVEKGNLEIASSKNVVYLGFKADQSTLQTTPDGKDKIEDTITLSLERTPLSEDFDSKKLTFKSSQNPNLPSERVAMSAGLGVNLEQLDPEQKDIQLRQGIARLLDSQLASPIAKSLLQRTGLIDKIEISQDSTPGRNEELRGNIHTLMDPFIGHSIVLEKTFGSKLGVGYRATLDKIKDRADFINQLELRYPFYKGFWVYGSTELDSKENLGREPERRGGIKTQLKFDPSDWIKNKKPNDEIKK